MSPTQRALKDAKALGFMAQVVERWNQWSKTRHDLFDCIDIIACRPDSGVVGIQVTSDNNHAARMEKARKSERISVWLSCGVRFEVWSYGKKGAKGKRKMWTLRREELRKDANA